MILNFFKKIFNSSNKLNPDKKKFSLTDKLNALKNLPSFFKLVYETSPGMTIGNIILRIIKSAIPLLTLYVGKLIIDAIVHSAKAGTTDNLTHIFFLVGVEFCLGIISDLLGRGIALFDSLLGDKFSNVSSVKLMQHASILDLDQFEDSEFYDKLELARRQTLSRTVLMSQIFGQAQDIITLMFLSGGLIVFNPWLIVLLILAVIPAFLGESHFNEESYSLVHGWTPERRELDYLRFTGASDDTAKEVKIFGLSGFLIDRFRFLSEKYYTANKKLAVKRAGWGLLFSILGTAGYYAAYIFIIIDTVNGRISLGDLTFLSGSFSRLRGLLETILTRFSEITEGALYLKDFFEFFEMKPNIVIKPDPVKFPDPIKTGFTFENVGFKYRGSDKWALRNINFHLFPKEKLALVGENGAGKTTLVKLLARLYDPTEGRILLDGRDLRDYNPEELKKEIGVIFQDFVRFQMTASNNIAVGRIEEKDNYNRIDSAAKRSLAESVITSLPKGYDQMIGKRFSDGVELSGGQWQKIALARAYMRDAQLLILDEPTASLDARAEYEIFQKFAELTNGKTVVLISHRFSTVRMADRILVLYGGQLEEAGTHDQLIEKGGLYSDLFNLQARGYR